MAQIDYNNSITTVLSDLERFANAVPEMAADMLKAQADVVEPALKQGLSSDGLVQTGRLKDSIGRTTRKRGQMIYLGPTGEHHKYVTKAGRANVLRAGHLGYILEHGAPGRNIRGRNWMTKTIVKTQAKALDAAENVRDQYLSEHNL